MDRLRKVFHINGFIRFVCIFLINHVYAGVNPKTFPKKRKLLCKIGCQIGKGTKIVGPIYFYKPFTTGKDCWIGKNFTINGDGDVVIGDNCDIAPEVTLLTGGHDIGDHNRRAGKGRIYSIYIGSGCWIGACSTLVGSVVVNDGSLVAACSCVVKDVPKDTLVAGVPAKVIRQFEDN